MIVANYALLSEYDVTSSISESVNKDQVHLCTMEFLTLALLWHGFHDAIKEGWHSHSQVLEIFTSNV